MFFNILQAWALIHLTQAKNLQRAHDRGNNIVWVFTTKLLHNNMQKRSIVRFGYKH